MLLIAGQSVLPLLVVSDQLQRALVESLELLIIFIDDALSLYNLLAAQTRFAQGLQGHLRSL